MYGICQRTGGCHHHRTLCSTLQERPYQTLRIPRDLELPGRAATLRKEGARLIVEPVAGPSLLAVLADLNPLDDELPRIARPAPEPVDV